MGESDTYYRKIADYYDTDASDFEQRYTENPILQRLRNEFRRITETYPFNSALEIGCGPGFDIEYFAKTYPDREIDAIDVSPGMVELAEKRIKQNNLTNTSAKTGSVEDLPDLYPDKTWDLIYVFFGGLNTVYDLRKAALTLHKVSHPGTRLVLTFVNRYYLLDALLWTLRLRFDRAPERLFNRWNGYSEKRPLKSRVISSGDVRRAFEPDFKREFRQGYSILYPAWYRANHLPKLGSIAELLWKADRLINKTPFWNTGEYSLYVYRA